MSGAEAGVRSHLSDVKAGETVKYHGSKETCEAVVLGYGRGVMKLRVNFSDVGAQERLVSDQQQTQFQAGSAKSYGISKVEKPSEAAQYAGHTPITKLLLNLNEMKRDPEKGDTVYAVFQTGALNPPHRGHMEMLACAKAAYEAKGLPVAGGWMGPTGDWYVQGKARRTSDPPPRMLFDKLDRLKLSQMIVEASPHQGWLDVDEWDIQKGGYDFAPHMRQVQEALDAEPAVQVAVQRAGFSKLQVVYVMGDDHFRRCCRSYKAAVVVGRVDITEPQKRELVARAKRYPAFAYADADARVAELSSTKFRRALASHGSVDTFDDKFVPKEAWDYAKARVAAAMAKCPQ